jgi:hypothetical protein
MQLISVLLIIIGFIVSLYGGVKLSSPEAVLNSAGEINQSKLFMLTLIVGLGVGMCLLGFLAYYPLRGNVPYFMNYYL